MRYALLTVIFLLGSFTSSALAQTAEQRAACQADAKKFCAGVLPGGGRMLACLVPYKDKLSEACKKVVESQGK